MRQEKEEDDPSICNLRLATLLTQLLLAACVGTYTPPAAGPTATLDLIVNSTLGPAGISETDPPGNLFSTQHDMLDNPRKHGPPGSPSPSPSPAAAAGLLQGPT